MTRLIMFILWLAIGFCLFLSGCSAALTAENLEARIILSNPFMPTPTPPEISRSENRPDNPE